MAATRATIVGSERPGLVESVTAPVDPHAHAQISVYFRRPAEAPVDPEAPRDRSDLRTARADALGEPMDRVAAFAREEGLTVVARDPARRLMQIAGPLRELERAFEAKLRLVDGASGRFRARSGVLTAPSDVADLIEAVLGLDQRPIATPKLLRIPASATRPGRLPSEVVRLYGFPTPEGLGRGACVAIIELGGGVSPGDTEAAFAAMGLAPPIVAPVLVGAGTNQPGADPNADGEVALDIQVAGAGAPGATLAVYFAANTDQGFVDAISQAAHDATHKPGVMSISWGSAESAWTAQAITAMTSAFQDAADLGVSVFAASGDGLATDGVADGRAHVDFPASSPWVVGCGGTRLENASDAMAGETVWNSNGGGTGGGVSDLFPVPAYQAALHLPPPPTAGQGGRGVPDVAGDADPDTGYRVIVDGKAQVIGGTSAVAPLWAGLFALVGAMAGKPVGQPHARLYDSPDAFNDVTQGDNRHGAIGFAAAPGWDACTGLGTPKGTAVAALFTSASTG